MKTKNSIIILSLFTFGLLFLTMCKKQNHDNSIKEPIEKPKVVTTGAADYKLPDFSVSLTIKMGHTSASCAGIGEICPTLLPPHYTLCHIPCIGKGEACDFTITVGTGIINRDQSHFDGYTDYDDFSIQRDSIFIAPRNGSPSPEYWTWKDMSIKPASSGYGSYINIPEQVARKRYTTDSGEYFVLKSITYSSTPAYTDQY